MPPKVFQAAPASTAGVERGPRCSLALQRLLTYSHCCAAPSTCLCLAFSDELLSSDAVTPRYLLRPWQLGADELPHPDPCIRRSWGPTAEPVCPSLLCLTNRQLQTLFSLERDPHFWKRVHLPGEALCVLQSTGSPAQDGMGWIQAGSGASSQAQEHPARLARLLLMGSSLANAQGTPSIIPVLTSSLNRKRGIKSGVCGEEGARPGDAGLCLQELLQPPDQQPQTWAVFTPVSETNALFTGHE